MNKSATAPVIFRHPASHLLPNGQVILLCRLGLIKPLSQFQILVHVDISSNWNMLPMDLAMKILIRCFLGTEISYVEE